MGGGDFPPGFPSANPTVSYWQDPPHPMAHHRTTADIPAQTWDYVIVGSGISGAALAFKLLSRDAGLKVLMLEARTAASGASGRNGGHCRPGWWLRFREFATVYGLDEALRLEALEEGNVADVADFVREHGVDNEFQDVETMDVFVTPAAWEEALARLDFRARAAPHEPPSVAKTPWPRDQARARLGMPDIAGAVTYAAHAQNPYLLVCRMLEMAVAKGLNLQTTTAALAVREHDEEDGNDDDHDDDDDNDAATTAAAAWTVDTDRGRVWARNVVLATNAYTNSLHAGLAGTGFLTPARSQVAALRPGDSMDRERFLYGRSGGPVDVATGDYFMTRAPHSDAAGDVVWGGGRSLAEGSEVGVTDDSVVNRRVAAYLHGAPAGLYGADNWGSGSVVRDWTGITCYTPDGLPLVGPAPGRRGLWMTVGMNGHGMGLAFRCAEALVQTMVSGGQVPEWFPRSMRLERAWEQAGRGWQGAWEAEGGRSGDGARIAPFCR